MSSPYDKAQLVAVEAKLIEALVDIQAVTPVKTKAMGAALKKLQAASRSLRALIKQAAS